MKKTMQVRLAILAAGSALVSGGVMAAPPTTVSELASSVDFVTVGVGILAVAGSVIALYVIWKGAQFVIKAVKGA